MTERVDDKPLWGLGEVLWLSLPAGATMLTATLMRFVDALMVGQVGPAPFSAQLYGGMTAFVPESIAVGTLTVVSTYVSQNLGAGRHRRCGQYAWAGVLMGLAYGLLVFPIGQAAAGGIFRLIGHAEAALETMYFRYMLGAVVLALPTMALQQFFYGVHRPRVVFLVSLIGNLFNVGANYVLIFGKLGFPALGLQGAAIGTVCGWGLMLAALLGTFLCGPIHRRYRTRRPRGVRWRHARDILRVGWPAGVQLVGDIGPWWLFMVVLVAPFGLVHRTAGAAVFRYVHLSFMPAIGVGIAVTALVGRYIGAGRPDLARRRTRVGVAAATVYMTGCGVAFLLAGRELVDFVVRVGPSPGAAALAQRQEVLRIGGQMMICAAAFQLFDAVNIVYSRGLRGAGDTLYPMVMTIVLAWGIIVGGGLLMVRLLPRWESLGPWLAASAYVILLGAVMARRFEGGAWRRIDLLGRRGVAATAPIAPGAEAEGAFAPPADVSEQTE